MQKKALLDNKKENGKLVDARQFYVSGLCTVVWASSTKLKNRHRVGIFIFDIDEQRKVNTREIVLQHVDTTICTNGFTLISAKSSSSLSPTCSQRKEYLIP